MAASPSRLGMGLWGARLWGLRLWGLLAAALLCATLIDAAVAVPKFPALTGRIVDEAGILSGQDYAALNEELAGIEKASTDQVVVVTLKSLQGYTIEDFGYQLGRAWGIGQKDKNNGILLIVAPNEHKVRIEVGYGLEPIMTDALSKLIIENAILPEFRLGHFAAGINAGLRDIKDVLLGDADAVKERARSAHGPGTPETLQVLLFVFWLCVAVYILWAIYRSSLSAQKPGLRRQGPIFFPGSSGSWDGGWSGGDGGGGWSGGGGSFGGGGSSGSW
jgi:uncharacterized protein